MSIDLIINTVEGWLFEGEARMLNRRASEVEAPLCVVEIGSYRGKSTLALAHNLQPGVALFAVDPHSPSDGVEFGDLDREIWTRNVLSFTLAGRVRPINLPSLDVAKIWGQPIGMLFVDGNHAEVAADLDAWLPYVVEGGMVGTHDANGPAIIQAVTARDDLVEIERSDITVIYRKEPLYEPYEYDGITMLVRKGPYNHDDKYVLAEVRGYDIGTEPIHTCIDVGAHIGAFSAWLHSLWPDASIIAAEPEVSGYLTALANVGDADEIALLNARVNYDQGDKVLYVNPINSGCHKIKDKGEPGEPVVPAPAAVTLEELMGVGGFTTLDLLKVDCEGCETDVLMNCTDELLQHTRRVCGEFHGTRDEFIAGIGARLQALGFSVEAETNPALHSTFVAVNNTPQPSDVRPSERPIGREVPKDTSHEDLKPKAAPKAKPGRKAKAK